MRLRRPPAQAVSAADLCTPYLPELQRIVRRCVGEERVTAAVLEEVVARASRSSALPEGPALRRRLFQLAHDVLLERRRAERAPASRPAPVRRDLSGG